MSGVPGKFFVQFGWTAAIAVFFSLVVARMLTPMMAAYILKPNNTEHKEPGWMEMYMRWGAGLLSHHRVTHGTRRAGLPGHFLRLSGVPAGRLGFIPPDDLSQTQVTLTLPPGSNFRQTHAAAEEARHIVEQNPYVKLIYTAIGGGSAGGDPFDSAGAAQVNKAVLTINMTHRSERHLRRQQAGGRGPSCARRSKCSPVCASRSDLAAPTKNTCWYSPATMAMS